MSGEWSWLVPIAAGLVGGLFFYGLDLARASARLDAELRERIRLLTGGFDDADMRKIALDRVVLYKAAWELYNAWVVLWNKSTRGSEEEMLRAMEALQDRVGELQRLVPESDLEAIVAYHRPLSEIRDILLSDGHPYSKAGSLEEPMQDLARAAREDQWWDFRRRGRDPFPHHQAPIDLT